MKVDTRGLAEIAVHDGYVVPGMRACLVAGTVEGFLACALRQITKYNMTVRIRDCFTIYRQGSKIVIKQSRKWRDAI